MIVGTAGHVDHGKTALVKALTGVDTDRLAEERRRGLTIELGFAPLELPDGKVLGVVDVPGHEHFIPTMLAGCAGMDLVLLAIAADEGPMPQTREHLAILSLLGMERGIIVLTRSDLGERQGLRQQVAELVQGTFLEQAPVVPVSAVSGQGINELKEYLAALAFQAAPPADGPFRLHVDRVFSVSGSGTVVTGSLTGGPLRQGETVTLWPSQRQARIRTLQCHGKPVEMLPSGCRAAVNLAGVKVHQINRGDTLAPANSLTLTQRLDVSLSVLAQSPYGVKNNSTLHLHHGGRAVTARCILLGQDRLLPGTSGFAQLRLDTPLAAAPGDKFVVRFFSPVLTIGGGVVVDATPPLRGRKDPRRIARLERLAAGYCQQEQAQPVQAIPSRPQSDPVMEQALCMRYREAGLCPPSNREMEAYFPTELAACRAAGRALADRGVLAPLSPQYRAWGASCEEAQRYLRHHFGSATFTLAQARDLLGISRRYALLLLEYWDRIRVTKRMGEGRRFL